jgi:excisionase family DNA binding protein
MENKTPTRRLWKLKDAANYLGLSAWKVRKLVADGELPYVQDKTLGPFLLDVVDLDLWIEKNKTTKAG